MPDGGDRKPNPVLQLIAQPDKRAVERFCHTAIISSSDLADMLWSGRLGAIGPFQYDCHFDQTAPKHLWPTDEEHHALATNGVGPMKPLAAKFARKIGQLFQDRRIFAAHLFYLPDYSDWHLIYFDQRDMSRERNHWKKGGAHVHYTRRSFVNRPLIEVWGDIHKKPPNPPSAAVHVPYIDDRERGFAAPGDRA
jgi:hypothetical protein